MSQESAKSSTYAEARERLAWNVVASWMAHLVVVVVGFVLPRLIDSEIGPVALGVWDLSWSLVNYMTVVSDSVGSSLNRFVANCRAEGNFGELNRYVLGGIALQGTAALLLFCGIGALFLTVPRLLDGQAPTEITTAQNVVGLLGLSVVLRTCLQSSSGVITGCHRWGVQNALTALESVGTAVLMVTVLLAGYGLTALAASYLLVVSTVAVLRVILAFRVCPELELTSYRINLSTLKSMLVFDGKTMLSSFPVAVLIQTARVSVAAALGPVALAVLARPVALTSHIGTLINKFAMVLTPVSATFESSESAEVGRFLIESVRYAAAVAFPLLAFMAVNGDLIMVVWMGPEYVNHEVAIILAAGYLIPMSQRPIMRVMMGLNLHGALALVSFIVVLSGLALGLLILEIFGWSLPRAALLIVGPLILNNMVLPVVACKRLDLSIRRYYVSAFRLPIGCAFVLVFVLMATRLLLSEMPLASLLAGGAVAGLTIGPLYWRFLLSEPIRKKLLSSAGALVFRTRAQLSR